MQNVQILILASILLFAFAWKMVGVFFYPLFEVAETGRRIEVHIVELPEPQFTGVVSVEEAIQKRRSIRTYKNEPLTKSEVSQLSWAAVGKTVDGLSGPTRAYPSAGASHPLELLVVVGYVEGLKSGVYRYNWQKHSLELLFEGDLREDLMKASLKQSMIANAPISLVFTAVFSRTTARYGQRGEARYVPMDAGAAFQNVHLQAQALGLGTVIVGAFDDEAVSEVLNLEKEIPIGIMPIGRL